MIGRDAIPQARLRELVAQARGTEDAELGEWQCQALHYDARGRSRQLSDRAR